MEVERERKEKLAAARKKLDEYKLNRSGGKSPAVTTAASTKPADVPLFYQNLNAPTATFNIFNPVAAVDNNNVVPPASSYFSQSESILKASPVPPVFTPEGAFTDPPKETIHLFHISKNQSQSPPVIPLQEQLDNSHQPVLLNPFAQPVLPPSVQQLAEERQSAYGFGFPTTTTTTQASMEFVPPSSTTFGLFPSPSLGSDTSSILQKQSQSGEGPAPKEDIAITNFGNIPISFGEKPSDLDERDLQEINLGVTEYFPSAPPFDSRTSPSPNKLVDLAGGDHAEDHKINEDHSKIEKSVNTGARRFSESENLDLNISGSGVQIFASSLFGSTGNSELDTIFSVNANLPEQATPVPVIPEEPLQAEHIRFDHESSTPQKNTLFSPTNEVEEDIIKPLQTFNDIAAEPPPMEIGFVCGTNFDSAVDPLAVAERVDNANNSSGEVPASDNWSSAMPQPVFADHSVSLLNDSNNQISPDVLPKVMPPANLAETNFNRQFSEENDAPFEPAKAQGTNTDEEVVCQMKSVQEAMELQIEELRRENEYLVGRQTELTSKIEESEKLAHDFKVDRDRIKEESMTTSQALRARINSLCEENQRIVKNSTDVGVDLRAMMEEKTKQLEEMQKAVIVVSQSKMDFAGKLDNELERVKELQNTITAKDEEIYSLRVTNAELQEKLKLEQQKDAVIHQLQDQARHYQVQTETLQKELYYLRLRMKDQSSKTSPQGNEMSPTNAGPGVHHPHHHTESSHNQDHGQHSSSFQDHDHTTESSISTDQFPIQNENVNGQHHHHSGTVCEHDHSEHHDHSHADNHDHDHDDHHHEHGHGDHHHEHDHGDHQHHDHHHGENVEVVARRGPTDEVTELKKTLHRLQWENSTFRNELDILAVDAKQKHTYEEKCSVLEDENALLRKEVEQLEHVIIQLQGENDTIGDYVTLYQTQKMALKECAKEKDAQLELLAREREMLLHRLAELTALVQDLKESKSEVGSQCAGPEDLESSFPLAPTSNNKRQIEGKIRDLLSEISSSSLVENFHPCAVCSGRLMTV